MTIILRKYQPERSRRSEVRVTSRDGHNRYSTLSFVALKARGHEIQKESQHAKTDFTEW